MDGAPQWTMRHLLFVALLACAGAASAGHPYAAIGVPGLLLGYAAPVSDSFTLRADVSSIGTHSRSKDKDGIHYDGKLKANRIGLFADWFVAGGFRLTGGVTAHDARLDLSGRGNGGTITIGNRSYVTGPDDRFDAALEFPRTMPYLGIGFGHRNAEAKGWSGIFDLGLSFGKPKVSGRASGPLLSNTVAQEDVDRELEEIRDDVRRVKGIPQISFGLAYRF
jgi:hypothetical protein